MAGSDVAEPAAETKLHSGANSLRPAPISLVVKADAGMGCAAVMACYPSARFFFGSRARRLSNN